MALALIATVLLNNSSLTTGRILQAQLFHLLVERRLGAKSPAVPVSGTNQKKVSDFKKNKYSLAAQENDFFRSK
jgi:hypothetical protein